MQNITPQAQQQLVESETLYVVATPIGNLSDISLRARSILSQVSIVAAEDTRHARQLLATTEFSGRLIAYHDFADAGKAEDLIRLLKGGESIALISDAGTPLISDPGFKLVRLARREGLAVFPIPGACAVTAALSVAGLPTDRFTFEGFLPNKAGLRERRLDELLWEQRSMVFYESPRRMQATVVAMLKCFGGQRPVFLAREMTKKFEEHFQGTLTECVEWLEDSSNRQKGEFVLVLQGASAEDITARQQHEGLELVKKLGKDLSLRKAVSIAAETTGAGKNALYAAALKNAQDKL